LKPTKCADSQQKDYRGEVSVTKSGKTCQKWDVQFPHPHLHTPLSYPASGLSNNYCRNPGAGRTRAWCYTIDSATEWEYCDVDCSAYQSLKIYVPIEPQCADPKQSDYRGHVSVTKTGKTCQRWDSQLPHNHNNKPEQKPNKGLEYNNYCRNPDGSAGGAWCYTTDPKTRWENCDIDCKSPPPPPAMPVAPPLCNGTECLKSNCVDPKQSDYRGHESVTKSGKTCQRWDQQTPHRHSNTPQAKPKAGLDENNFCRNPDGEVGGAWCYTTDAKTRWEYCDVDCEADMDKAVAPQQKPRPKQDDILLWLELLKPEFEQLEKLNEEARRALTKETKVVNLNFDRVMKFIAKLAEKKDKQDKKEREEREEKLKNLASEIASSYPKSADLIKFYKPELYGAPKANLPSFVQTSQSAIISDSVLVSNKAFKNGRK